MKVLFQVHSRTFLRYKGVPDDVVRKIPADLIPEEWHDGFLEGDSIKGTVVSGSPEFGLVKQDYEFPSSLCIVIRPAEIK